MQPVANAVIAAAGLGSRLGLGMPKCMIEINGRPLLDMLVANLRPYVRSIFVVVGYREDLVTTYCRDHLRDVIIVRNPKYRSTNTAFSLAVGADNLSDRCIFLDGDLIVTPSSLQSFISLASCHEVLVGVTTPKSEKAVFADCTVSEASQLTVTSFSADVHTSYEWANVFVGPSSIMNGASGYVFEQLSRYLPLPGCMIDLCEIDTPGDLSAATGFVRDRFERSSS